MMLACDRPARCAVPGRPQGRSPVRARPGAAKRSGAALIQVRHNSAAHSLQTTAFPNNLRSCPSDNVILLFTERACHCQPVQGTAPYSRDAQQIPGVHPLSVQDFHPLEGIYASCLRNTIYEPCR